MAAAPAPARHLQPLRGPVTGGRSGRLSINVGCIYDDTRAGIAEQRMLGVLGTYADSQTGWCFPSYPLLAQRLGIKRAAVGHAITGLADLGYLEIHERFDPATGGRLSSVYRLVQNYELPDEHRRARDDETPLATESSYPPPEAPPLATLDAVPPLLPLATLATESSYLKERLIRTTNPDDETVPSVPAPARERPPDVMVQEPPPPPSQTGSSPPKSPARPSTKPLLPAPKPQPRAERTDGPQARLVTLLRDGGVPDAVRPSERDFAAVKQKCQDIELVAACYLDIYHGRYGDAFMQRRLTIQAVCYSFLDGYLAWKAQGDPSPRATAGRDGPRFRKDGSRIYTSDAGSPMPADLQALIDKNTAY